MWETKKKSEEKIVELIRGWKDTSWRHDIIQENRYNLFTSLLSVTLH